MADEIIKVEQQLLSLLLKRKDLVEDYMESPLGPEHFDSGHKIILHAIEDAFRNDVLLTRKSFLEYISRVVSKKKGSG